MLPPRCMKWLANVCRSTWVMRVRGEQIGALFKAVHAAKGGALMVTFTAGHSVDQKLEFLLDAVKKASRIALARRRPLLPSSS